MATLKEIVVMHANEKINGKYNLPQYKAEREALKKRKEVCQSLIALMDKTKLPITLLVYVAVDKQSHRPQNFEKNYHRFNESKAEAIIKMAQSFAAHHGYKSINDKVMHGVCAYYERVNSDYDVFETLLNSMEQNNAFPTAKAVYLALGGH